MDKNFYTMDEVAEMLGVHRNTVYRWVRIGQVPHIRIGRFIKIPHAAVNQILTPRGGNR